MGESSKVKQIKGLIIVLSAGLSVGLLIALSMLYYYNPTGSYHANNVLLDADNAYSLRFVEPGPKGKSEGRYVFDGINFSYFDQHIKQTKSLSVTKDKYAQLYGLIAEDNSLFNPNLEIQGLFNQTYLATLALNVRSTSEDSSKGVELTFSKIQFVYEDYYRIQLRQSQPGAEWIYFYHPKIYQKTLNLFAPAL